MSAITKRTDTAIQYILRHPVLFGAKYNDRFVLMNNHEFHTAFDDYIKTQKIVLTKTPLRKYAQIIWEYYTLWINRPNNHINLQISAYRLENTVDYILINAADYIGKHPQNYTNNYRHCDTIRMDKSFREIIMKKIKDDPSKFDDMSQKEMAEFVWPIYKSWVA